MRLEQRRLQETLDEVEAGPSQAVISKAPVSRHVKQRKTMTHEQLKKTKKK